MSAAPGPPATPVVTVAWLTAALATDQPPVLLDVRWNLPGSPPAPPGRAQFDGGHVPGAQFVDLDVDLADPPGEAGRHPLPDPERFAAAMRRCGVRHDRTVVVMDGGPSVAAARCWWLLRHHGHADVRVLDGGLAAWLAAGGPLTTVPTPASGDLVAAPGRLPVVDAAAAARLARSGVLLDARAPARYRGEVEPVDPVAGHIPGAVNLPTASITSPDGTLLPADRLHAVLADVGVTAGTAVAASCGSGVTAAHTLLALEVAGIPAALYPGSFSEWLRDPARPVATGPDPG